MVIFTIYMITTYIIGGLFIRYSGMDIDDDDMITAGLGFLVCPLLVPFGIFITCCYLLGRFITWRRK